MDRAERPIRRCAFTVGVGLALKQLANHPDWNRYSVRTEQYAHSDVSDMWVRFNAWKHYNGDLAAFNRPHTSVWYPCAFSAPALQLLVWDVLAALREQALWGNENRPDELGGVLITRIPPGGRVEPHVDRGWHAEYYRDKYAVQLQGNERQAFCFDDFELRALPGEVYWFDNQQRHWVTNDSDTDRMTMIICTREAD